MTETKRLWVLRPMSRWPERVQAMRSQFGRPGSEFWTVEFERGRRDSFEEGVSIFRSEKDARRWLVTSYREKIAYLETRIKEELALIGDEE